MRNTHWRVSRNSTARRRERVMLKLFLLRPSNGLKMDFFLCTTHGNERRKKQRIWDDYEWDSEAESESADSNGIWLWWGSPRPLAPPHTTSRCSRLILHIWLGSWFIVKQSPNTHNTPRTDHKFNEKSKERARQIEFQEAIHIAKTKTKEPTWRRGERRERRRRHDVKNDTFQLDETTWPRARENINENYLQINKH